LKRRPEETLTPREFEAATVLAVDGAQNHGIAKLLGISSGTVKVYIKHAMIKSGSETRTALALWYVRKYPTAKARGEGYVNACLYAVDQTRCARRFRVSLAARLRAKKRAIA
jgi:DNA-binding CsgD family transcriptional regulator